MPRKAVNVFVPPVGALTSMFFLSFMFFTPHNCVFEKSSNLEKNHSLTKEFSISFTSSALLASIYSIFAIFLFYYTSLIKLFSFLLDASNIKRKERENI